MTLEEAHAYAQRRMNTGFYGDEAYSRFYKEKLKELKNDR